VADDRLAAAFKRASEIVKGVPKHLQETAFNRALDQLLKQADTTVKAAAGKQRSKSRSKPGSEEPASPETDALDLLLRDLDRTKFPEISADKQVLPNALGVLRAAKRDHAVDGLQPPHIARILTDKFRISTSDAAVSMALGNAGKYVDRVKVGRGYTYRLMEPGEKYLTAPPDSEAAKGKGRVTPVGHRKSSKKGRPEDGAKTSKPRRASPAGSRPGPKAAVDSLVKAGFFSKPRVLGDIKAHLQVERGYTYAVTDLSPAMTRAVRSGDLKRSRRQDGQYEYQAG
jgi:hypothetical protein